MNEEPGYRGSSTRFAFWADTEEEVDRVGRDRACGRRASRSRDRSIAMITRPGYYAVFFEDGDGNKWEICCRTSRMR